jgi:hypothetical protein
MSDEYNEKSCNALEKPYYKPIEAALRWCNLVQHEVEILRGTGNSLFPGIGVFPQWPCLRANAEKIYDAMLNGELLHGRDGRTVSHDDHVARERMTVRHTDLKAWMAKHYPDQKPKFLFDEVERTTHAAINAESFRALQVDRDALKARIDKAEIWAAKIIAENKALIIERDSLRSTVGNKLTTTERITLLTIIAALCDNSKIEHQGRGAAAQIARLTEASGTPVSEDAVGDALKKIPNATETRMK